MRQSERLGSPEHGRWRSELEDKGIFARNAAILAFLALLLAIPAAFWWSRLALVLALAAGVEGAIATSAAVRRRDFVKRLALEPEAYAIADVRRFGSRLTSPKERQRLATWIREMIRDAPLPGSLYLADRVEAHREELEFIARDIASPDTQLHPSSAAACLQALASPVESPFYNYRLPADQIASMLGRIRRGIDKR
jgi:hypothetical protein